ncbi:MAG: rhamnan synthesis F family protein [Lachnospiraceae bacterium]|nr:rhamnan synthesis F family protein [Lachnospiraceae bacterium]
MILDSYTKNRCIIFLYYDKDGLVDRYVTGLLDALGKVSSRILVVVNGYITDAGERELRTHANDVLVRVNTGFDVGGYREGIFWLGFGQLAKYDELILMNYTFFAPLFPLENMFREMGKRDVDFWGITKHHAVPVDTTGGRIRYGHIPEHLNSHFLALRRDFFLSYNYRDFIMNMANPISYEASINDYEAVFTKHFADMGCKWDVYMDTDAFEGVVFAPFMFEGGPLVDMGCPIVKRRLFFGDYFSLLANSAGESYSDAYQAVWERTDYDVSLIWENLLRLQDRNAVRYAIHESFVVDSETMVRRSISPADGGSARQESTSEKLTCLDKIWEGEAAICIIGSEIEADFLAGRYLRHLPDAVPVLFFDRTVWDEEGNKELSDAVSRYGHVCVLNLPDYTKSDVPHSNATSLFYADCESLIGTGCHVANVTTLFYDHPELGLLVPPMPTFGCYFEQAEDGWYGRYEDVARMAEELGLSFPILRGEMPPVFPFGGSFWARGEVLAKTFSIGQLAWEDSMLGMLMMPYLFQKFGYMTGTVTGPHYAAVELTNLEYELREHNREIFRRVQPDAWWKVLDELK